MTDDDPSRKRGLDGRARVLIARRKMRSPGYHTSSSSLWSIVSRSRFNYLVSYRSTRITHDLVRP